MLWKIYVDERLYKRMRKKRVQAPHPTQIIQAAKKIVRKERQIAYRNYQATIEVGGSFIHLTYQFQEKNELCVKEAIFRR